MNDYHAQARQLIEQAQAEHRQGGAASAGVRLGESVLHAARTAAAMHVAFLGGNPAAIPSGQEGQDQ